MHGATNAPRSLSERIQLHVARTAGGTRAGVAVEGLATAGALAAGWISGNLTKIFNGFNGDDSSWEPTVASVFVILIIYGVRWLIARNKTDFDRATHVGDLQAQQWQALIEGYKETFLQQEQNHKEAVAEQRDHYLGLLQHLRDEKHDDARRAQEILIKYKLVLDRARCLGYDLEALTAPEPEV